ncbi:protein MKS1-like [Hibiscus syriacus]|uniref:protein MKS1-like n=1 Tax=Hibiscus syriacus TaxID=106335 RepID=UPI001922E276|nr:protein MKS1-like [Hibiscus syriacus]
MKGFSVLPTILVLSFPSPSPAKKSTLSSPLIITHGFSVPRRRERPLQIQGPRPTPLKVNKDSHKIRKPPHPPPHAAVSDPLLAAAAAADQRRQPVIIYAVSPKVIHAKESEFMSIVQRYTGLSFGNSGAGDLSPVARLAVTEKASPGPREKILDSGIMGDGRMEEGLIRPPTGILSPAPETLPAGSTGTFFTPASEARMMSPWHYWSPMIHGSGFMASPSALLSGLLIPSPNSDIFAQIWNF